MVQSTAKLFKQGLTPALGKILMTKRQPFRFIQGVLRYFGRGNKDTNLERHWYPVTER
jgi:hypothetical protein